MKSGQSQRQSLKALLQAPAINLSSPKDKTTSAHQSHFASISMANSNVSARVSPGHFDITLPNFPLSPKPITSSFADGEDFHMTQKSMRLIKRISSFAKNASKDFETKVKMINHIEKRKIHAIQEDKPVVVQHPNSPIASPHTSIGDIFARSSSLVFKEEISLMEKKRTPLLVEHHRFVYFQIDCARFPTPLIINIYKGSDTSNSKLKVYVSKTNKKPSALSCDYSVESRNVKIYEKDYKSNFETPAYYFGIYSENRFEGSITYLFGEEVSRPKHVKSQSMYMSPRLKWKLKAPDDAITLEEIKEIQREKMMKRWTLSSGKNPIELNKHPLTPKEREYSSQQKKVIAENRINEVLWNKKVRDEEKLQKKLFSIGKHDLVKTIKGYVGTQRDIALSQQAFQKDWLTTLTFFPMLHNLRNLFNLKKKAHKKRQEIYLRFHYFVIKYRRNLRKKGETIGQRSVFDIRGALECHARMVSNVKENEYRNVVGTFLQAAMSALNIANSFVRKSALLNKYGERWMAFKKKRDLFKKLFLLLWDKYQRSVLADLSPASPSKPQLATMKSLERKPTFAEKSSAEKKAAPLPSPKGQPEDKRQLFVKYMLNLSYYRYNRAFEQYREKMASLDPAFRKMADYTKFLILDKKVLMKNVLIAKVENLEYDTLSVEDVSLGSKALELHRKKDLIRPPRLFYIPTMEDITKAIINVAKGELDVKLVESLNDIDF